MSEPRSERGRVLIAEDDSLLCEACAECLKAEGYQVTTAGDGALAARLAHEGAFEAIISDLQMPGMGGIELLRAVRERDLDVPVVLMTGDPQLETAMEAVELGALRYLVKPFQMRELLAVVEQAVRLHRLARLRRETLEALGSSLSPIGDRAGLEAAFARAVRTIWMAYQPIVTWSGRSVFAYEALVRTTEPMLPNPGALFDAAERLGGLDELGRAIRDAVGTMLLEAPASVGLVAVNLHPRDLLDPSLYSADAPLGRVAKRVVLEITERATLDQVKDVRTKVAELRRMGYRIAIDDLGAGYAGLTSFAQLEPEVVKFDIALVRDIHKLPIKQRVIRSMTEMCSKMGMTVIAEGIETPDERNTLIDLGCDLLQGYLFARPGPAFPVVAW